MRILHTIRSRIIVAFVLLATMVLTVGGVSLWFMLSLSLDHRLEVQETRDQAALQRDLLDVRIRLFRMLGTQNEEQVTSLSKLITTTLTNLPERIAATGGDRAKAQSLADGYLQVASLHRDFKTKKAYQEMNEGLLELHEDIKRDLDKRAHDREIASDAAASASMQRAAVISGSLALFAILLVSASAIALHRQISVRLRLLRTTLAAAADGDLDAPITVQGSDEIGSLALSLSAMLTSLRQTVLAIRGEAKALALQSASIDGVAHTMLASANHTSELANAAASGVEELSSGVNSMASSTEEMRASITEVARNAGHTSQMAQDTRHTAEAVGVSMQELESSNARIGQIADAIGAIVEQINLLALNATIEAARAGEAGRGFSVVASEVKALSHATQTQTKDIAQTLAAVCHHAERAVTEVNGIIKRITQVSEMQLTVSAAIEEQTATTSSIACMLAEAATTSSSVSANVSGLAGAAQETKKAASGTAEAAQTLRQLSERLQEEVRRFHVSELPSSNKT